MILLKLLILCVEPVTGRSFDMLKREKKKQ
jgi:hypothetical protein